ncbi:hypothetical protein N8747_00830 [Candidatus Pelagibacter sp.]|nr:hypothetical protein [Candidatus Pelagibacter sp.]|tara:strand:- start:33 stop:308 length:276 start_codon:yes stop_codon:yes gene_type:complete
MIKLFLLIFFILFNFYVNSFADEKKCNEFKKLSVEFFKCKGNLVKEKTISTGQNIIKDTKDYQSKEWSEEKKKMIKTKEKINKTKKKVLNQ